MIVELLILQLIGHLLADFTLQPQHWCNAKSKKVFSLIHFYHLIWVFVLSWLASFSLNFWPFALVITAIHGGIDSLKSWVELRSGNSSTNETYIRFSFFIDQSLHLVTLLSIVMIYSKRLNWEPIIHPAVNWITLLAMVLVCTKPTNILIRNVMLAFGIKMPDETSESERSLTNAGRLIGITERLLTLLLVIVQQYGAIGLIIAAKSILRFNNPERNEYVLIGTLLSFGIAIGLGVLFVYIF